MKLSPTPGGPTYRRNPRGEPWATPQRYVPGKIVGGFELRGNVEIISNKTLPPSRKGIACREMSFKRYDELRPFDTDPFTAMESKALMHLLRIHAFGV